MSGDSLRFAWAYGTHEVSTSRLRARTDSGRLVCTAPMAWETVCVVAEDRRCTDPMSGHAFSHTVTVTLNSNTHSGCGRPTE